MDKSFWEDEWATGQQGFHESRVNPLLAAHGPAFLAGGPHRVLVPLAGKSLDLCWLRDQGHRVVGVELVETAVEAFHEEQGIAAARVPSGAHECWRSAGIDMLCGDVLRLDARQVEGVRRVWDRAAMVALDPERRAAYVRLLRTLLPRGSRVLLNSFRYDTRHSSGPPHSITHAELDRLYAGCRRRLLAAENVLLRDDRRAAMLRERGHRDWWSELWEITL